ncbi:unnamed protein product [Meganyctiphanes norvegica]|uniref:Uncharacterized protein n=1 Tax=Meganyctiphanes norvegica TaxID=48144 RepID=A0AAV2QJC2_MEGNR
MVCFSRYDDEEHRPRSLPCGHSMCTECLDTAIRKQTRMCPKCRTVYSASNVKEIPVNYPLESVVELLSISKNTKGDEPPELLRIPKDTKENEFPECPEHQLQVSHRCSTHKAWVCQSCLAEDHSSKACKIITVNEELNIKKSIQIDQTKSPVNAFEKTCKKVEYTKKQCKKLMKECDKDIVKTEKAVQIFQENIQRKKNSRMQMDVNYASFCEKLGKLKSKRRVYDQAVTSLKTSETIKGVSQCSIEVRNETAKLQLLSHEIENESKLMMEAFQDNSNCRTGLPNFSITDGQVNFCLERKPSNKGNGNDTSNETNRKYGDPDHNNDNNDNNSTTVHDEMSRPDTSIANRLFIGGIKGQVEEHKLWEIFGQFGQVREVCIPINKETGHQKGFAYIEYGDSISADQAIFYKDHIRICGNKVGVNKAIKKHHQHDSYLPGRRGGCGGNENSNDINSNDGDGDHNDDNIDNNSTTLHDEMSRPDTSKANRLFIGGIKGQVEEHKLWEYFGRFGQVREVCIPINKKTGNQKGFAFIEYDDSISADQAIFYKDHIRICGNKVDVKKDSKKHHQHDSYSPRRRGGRGGSMDLRGGYGSGGNGNGYGRANATGSLGSLYRGNGGW